MKEMSQNETIALKTPPPAGDLDEHQPPEVRAANDLARRYRLPFVDLLPPDRESPIDYTLFTEIPVDLMVRHQFVPLKRDERGCTLRWQTRPISNVWMNCQAHFALGLFLTSPQPEQSRLSYARATLRSEFCRKQHQVFESLWLERLSMVRKFSILIGLRLIQICRPLLSWSTPSSTTRWSRALQTFTSRHVIQKCR